MTTMEAHILIDVQTGSMVAMDDDGEPVAESKRRFANLERKEWIEALLSLVYATGIERLEFIRGGSVEVIGAREFFGRCLRV